MIEERLWLIGGGWSPWKISPYPPPAIIALLDNARNNEVTIDSTKGGIRSSMKYRRSKTTTFEKCPSSYGVLRCRFDKGHSGLHEQTGLGHRVMWQPLDRCPSCLFELQCDLMSGHGESHGRRVDQRTISWSDE